MYLRVSAFIWCPALFSGNSNNPFGFGTLELLLEALAAGCIFTGCEAVARGPLQACALGGGCGCFVTCVSDMQAPEDFEAGGDGGNSFGFGAGGFAGGVTALLLVVVAPKVAVLGALEVPALVVEVLLSQPL